MRKATTRAANGSGTLHKRANGLWEAQFTVGRDPGTGKLKRRSVYAKTQNEARKKMAAAIAALDGNNYLDPDRITVAQWLDEWLKTYIEPYRKPLTTATYKGHIENHLAPMLGAVRLQALRQEEVQRCVNQLSKDLAPKTVNVVFGVLHSALRKALALGKIGRDPCFGVELPQKPKRRVAFLPDDKATAFLRQIQNDPYRDIFVLAMLTGARESELLGLCWADVDFTAGCIYIQRQLQKTLNAPITYYIQNTKSDRERTITPPPAAMELLQAIKKQQFINRIAAGPAWGGDSLFVIDGQRQKPFTEQLCFTNAIGKHYAHCTVREHFKKAVRAIGMPNTRFHGLRHTFAVVSLQEGCDLKTLQETLGHATSSFTLDVYGDVSKTMQQQNAERLQNHYKLLESTV